MVGERFFDHDQTFFQDRIARRGGIHPFLRAKAEGANAATDGARSKADCLELRTVNRRVEPRLGPSGVETAAIQSLRRLAAS